MKALIVEDEMIVALDLARTLKRMGYDVPAIAKRAEEALALIDQHQPDVVFIDIILKGDEDGIFVAHALRENHRIPFLFITAHADVMTVQRARETRPSGYLVKPFNKDAVYAATEIALRNFADEQIEAEHANQKDGGLPPFRLRKVMKYIGEHLDEDLTLSRLAEISGSSKYHFSRLFKQAVGMAPYQYVMQQRIDEAQRLLERTDLSVTEIALLTGFGSHGHFSKSFRRHVGFPPTQYRKEF